MLKVTIELVPGGRGEPVFKSQLRIGNDGTGTNEVGNYDVGFWQDLPGSSRMRTVGRGRVVNFPRQEGSPEQLTLLALASVLLDRTVDLAESAPEGDHQLEMITEFNVWEGGKYDCS